MKNIIRKYRQTSLILRIVIGMAVGILLALALPGVKQIGMAGTLFVRALKAIAPILVAVLVTASLAQRSAKLDKRFGLVIFFYILSTYLASAAAVVTSFLWGSLPSRVSLTGTVGSAAPVTLMAP